MYSEQIYKKLKKLLFERFETDKFIPIDGINAKQINELGAFDFDFIKELINDFLPKMCLGYVYDIHDRVNAITTIIDNMPIIGIFSGCITEISNFSGFTVADGSFSLIGNNLETVKKLSIKNKIITKLNFSHIPTMPTGGGVYSDIIPSIYRQRLAQILSTAAIGYIILHEIGHHKKGHLEHLKQNKAHTFNCIGDLNEDVESDADLFAVEILVDRFENFYKMISDISYFKNESYIKFHTLIIMIVGISLAIISTERNDRAFYLSRGVRILYNITALTLGLKNRYDINFTQWLTKDIVSHDEDFWNTVKRQVPFNSSLKQFSLELFDSDGLATEQGMLLYTGHIIYKTVHQYCQINEVSPNNISVSLQLKIMEQFQEESTQNATTETSKGN